MFRRLISFVFSLTLLIALTTSAVSAHTQVIDEKVGIAQRYVFTLQSPNEREESTVAVRLVLPDGLEDVMPDVAPGWKIEVKKAGEGEDAPVSEITWSGGEITEGQFEQFQFRAKAPAEETTLMWKAYQTYSDGKVVSWDQDPKATENLSEEEKEKLEEEGKGPFSETKIVNDLVETNTAVEDTNQLTTWIAYAALIAGLAGIVLALRKQPR